MERDDVPIEIEGEVDIQRKHSMISYLESWCENSSRSQSQTVHFVHLMSVSSSGCVLDWPFEADWLNLSVLEVWVSRNLSGTVSAFVGAFEELGNGTVSAVDVSD